VLLTALLPGSVNSFAQVMQQESIQIQETKTDKWDLQESDMVAPSID
jgi:hypothetical protein